MMRELVRISLSSGQYDEGIRSNDEEASMHRLRLPAAIAVLAILAGCAAPLYKKITYSVESREGKPVFVCKDASEGKCFLMVGDKTTKEARRVVVVTGQKADIPVAGAEDMVCYSASDDMQWPGCLKSGFQVVWIDTVAYARYAVGPNK
jgi:hypothetical protein